MGLLELSLKHGLSHVGEGDEWPKHQGPDAYKSYMGVFLLGCLLHVTSSICVSFSALKSPQFFRWRSGTRAGLQLASSHQLLGLQGNQVLGPEKVEA